MNRLAEALLRMSDMMLQRSDISPPLASRSSALMARQALENGLEERLEREAAGLGSTTTRAQLLVLHARDERLGEEVALLWQQLTRACHHHPYELTPTTAEMTVVLSDTWSAVERLAAVTE